MPPARNELPLRCPHAKKDGQRIDGENTMEALRAVPSAPTPNP